MVLGLWNKRDRKGNRYAARYEAREDRMVLVSGTRDTEKDTDMQPHMRTERTEW